jgi:hypothetical protein
VSDWLHALPVGWMAIVVFGGTYLVAAAIHWLVLGLATGERARALKGVSPGMLSPLGVLFGLLVAFVAAQVWADVDRATAAVNHEASALRAVVLLAAAFPGEPEARLRDLVARQIEESRESEWPAMARHRASLTPIPKPLADALAATVALPATTAGQAVAQREIISALENALDARRQRILLSQSAVNGFKWAALVLQAVCTLLAIAMVHSDSRPTSRLALGLFSTAIAVCLLLILSHDRPFTGQVAVPPDALLQVLPTATEVRR